MTGPKTITVKAADVRAGKSPKKLADFLAALATSQRRSRPA